MTTVPTLVKRLRESKFVGSRWYDDAQVEIEKLCAYYHYDVDLFTRRLAILSPRCRVRQNVQATMSLMSGGEKPDFMLTRSWDNAVADRMTGPKVTAFYRALKGDRDSVVLDVWTLRILGAKLYRNDTEYEQTARTVVRVANKLGRCPRDVQASLWWLSMRDRGMRPRTFGHALWDARQSRLF